MARHVSRTALTACAVALISMSATTAALAAPSRPASPVDHCIAEATNTEAEAWVCFGGTLLADGAEPRVVAPEIVDQELTLAPAGTSGVTTMSTATYDSWCENGSVCTRTISSYISETKGNAAYGDKDGVIGTFDVVIRTNLNGRQPQWRTWWKRDSGPTLSFTSAYVHCIEDETLIDTSCGHFFADNGDGRFTVSGSSAYYPGWIYGNRLNDSNDYFTTVDAYFTPTGYPRFTMAPLKAEKFYCWGTGNCYFVVE